MPSSTIQQLEAQLQQTKDPIPKIDLLNALALEWRIYDLTKAFELAHEAHQLAQKHSYSKGIATANCHLSLFFIKTGKFKEAEQFANQSLSIFESLEDAKGIAYATRNLGIVQLRKGDHELSFKYLAESAKVSRAAQDKYSEADALGYMGYIYNQIGDYQHALETYQKLLAYSLELKDEHKESNAYNALALLHENMRDFDKAEEYVQKGIALHQVLNDKRGLMIGYNLAGRVKLGRNELAAAEKSLLYAQKLSEALNDRFTNSFNLLDLGKVYHRQGKFDKALAYLNEALGLAGQLASKEIQFQTYEEIALLYQKKGDYKQAFHFFKKFHELAETVKSAEIKGRIKIQQATHQRQLAEKEAEVQRIRNTELKKALQALKNTQTQLVQAEKMASLGQLTAGIAHEINNPINFVSANIKPLKTDISELLELLNEYIQTVANYQLVEQFETAEALKDEYDYEFLVAEIHELLRGIEEGAWRTSEIVRGLRNFSRMDEGSLKLADVNQGIESALLILGNKLKHQVEVVKELGNLPQIICYPGKLNQVFMNVLNNAIDATADMGTQEGRKGIIHIKSFFKKNAIIVSIKDNGRGMSAEVQRRIFEPFYTTKAVGKGTGLGLSISYGIIHDHRGNIEVKSEVGAGTEFLICLPVL